MRIEPNSQEHRYAARLEWTGQVGPGPMEYATYGRSFRVRVQGKPELIGSADPVFRGDASKFNSATGKELGSGGLFVMQPETNHFAWAEGETVIQVHALGPWALNYVNPADDPRNAAPEEGAAPQGR